MPRAFQNFSVDALDAHQRRSYVSIPELSGAMLEFSSMADKLLQQFHTPDTQVARTSVSSCFFFWERNLHSIRLKSRPLNAHWLEMKAALSSPLSGEAHMLLVQETVSHMALMSFAAKCCLMDSNLWFGALDPSLSVSASRWMTELLKWPVWGTSRNAQPCVHIQIRN